MKIDIHGCIFSDGPVITTKTTHEVTTHDTSSSSSSHFETSTVSQSEETSLSTSGFANEISARLDGPDHPAQPELDGSIHFNSQVGLFFIITGTYKMLHPWSTEIPAPDGGPESDITNKGLNLQIIGAQ